MVTPFGPDRAEALRAKIEALPPQDREVAVVEELGQALNPTGKRFVLPFRFRSANGGRTSHHLISDTPSCIYEYKFDGITCRPSPGRQWKTTKEGMDRLAAAGRIVRSGKMIYYRRFAEDFPVSLIGDTWHDIGGAVQSRKDRKVYVVQTGVPVVERCLLMTTRPGDLVLDPTCGSGTTAFAAEQWGRRWITCDVSRVPLALARQRLLTATFPWYELGDESRGPAAGFIYKRRKNQEGNDIGGIVPHISMENFTNDQPPKEEVLVDRPEEVKSITRVCGPFCFEATIPTPVDWEGDGIEDSGVGAGQEHGDFVSRMLEVLRRSPRLHIGGGKTVTLRNIRPPAKTLSLSAEAVVDTTAPGQSPTLKDVIIQAAEKDGKLLPMSGKHRLFPQVAAIVQRYVTDKVRVQMPGSVKDLFLAPYYGWLVERLAEAIRPDTSAGEVPELPVYESHRGPGSTEDVDYWTRREPREAIHCHLNYVVPDTERWEQSAAYYIDKHPATAAFVKNAGMGFAIPYFHNGQMHDYEPDFIVRLKRADAGPDAHMIVETKGYDPLRDVKKAAAERWVVAVNADGRHGQWHYGLANKPEEVQGILSTAGEIM